MSIEAPYGSWKSPITSATLTKKSLSISQIRHDQETLYWVESRPEERGRNCIVQYHNHHYRDITPAPINVRTRAHEYGGQAYCIHEQIVYFCCNDDQRLYRIDTARDTLTPEALTGEIPGSFADLFYDIHHHRILCVREALPADKTHEPQASIVAIDPKSGQLTILVSGEDFYSNVSVSPDGKHLMWLSWNHPEMPWDHSKLQIAGITPEGNINTPKTLSDKKNVSLFQPQWGFNEDIFFVSDQSGWWNIHHYSLKTGVEQNILPIDADFGLPQWVFGMSTFQILSEQKLACCFTTNGEWQLILLDITSQKTKRLSTEFNWFSDLHVAGNSLVYLRGNCDTAPTLVQHFFEQNDCHILQVTSPDRPETNWLSQPEKICFSSGSEQQAHAFFYPPQNPDYTAPKDEKPPLIVLCHGGPTGATEMLYNLKIQFWTTRGFAVVDVNYRGSTGYGRAYRDALKGLWGIADVEDCVNAAKYLVANERVDTERLAIKGSSAGGYTVLCALTFHHIFKAGASYYGIGDLKALLNDTHKFESRYLDSLIGSYPQQSQRYYDRSPLNFSDQLNCPCIFLQGMKDKVVPPNQAKTMVHALQKQGIPVSLVLFDEEAHGFRQASNIQSAIEAELYFYSRVFSFSVADNLKPINIYNEKQLDSQGNI